MVSDNIPKFHFAVQDNTLKRNKHNIYLIDDNSKVQTTVVDLMKLCWRYFCRKQLCGEIYHTLLIKG